MELDIKKSIVEFLEVLAHRWRLTILVLLKEGSMSGEELRQKLSELSQKDHVAGTSFSLWMSSLCDLGLVAKEKEVHNLGLKYTLTPLGSSALGVYSYAAGKMEKGLKDHQLQNAEKDTW